MPVRIPAWQAQRPLHGALDKAPHFAPHYTRLALAIFCRPSKNAGKNAGMAA
jgi:hypothetical protein